MKILQAMTVNTNVSMPYMDAKNAIETTQEW